MTQPQDLDQALFDLAADHVIIGLKHLAGGRVVVFEPGDGTRYEFVFIYPTTTGRYVSEYNPMGEGPVDEARSHNWYVGVAGLSTMYPWAGGPVHPDYATEKWSYVGNAWTGIVVSRMLTTIAERLEGQ